MKRSRGRIFADQLLSVRELGIGLRETEPHVHQVIHEFVKFAEAIPTRWIQMPKAILLFLTLPHAPGSGDIFLYDRERREFYFLSFEEKQRALTVEEFSPLLREYKLLRYAEKPALLRARVPSAGCA